ncbi:hypothetical protein PR048_013188 [Dryococelus australis]|uniref:Uncharacterized protein n=1 Tax=Dryococelus australis TaxID=614101 RepID=A0ABQ9HS99_9NEOP|nr:hypothetical protein PR048_013188 [Dryococelus australis]
MNHVERLYTALTSMMSLLALVTFAYNISRQDCTGFSPFIMLYGRGPILHSEECLNEKQETKGQEEAHPKLTMEKLHRQQERDKPSQEVLIFTPVRKKGLTPKFFYCWNGCAIAVKKLNSNKIQRELKTSLSMRYGCIWNEIAAKMWLQLLMLFSITDLVSREEMAVGVIKGAPVSTSD